MDEIIDPRNIRHGREIPTESYADQPYVVKTDDGAWLCVLTTGAGREGQAGQHVITMRSVDMGKTWSEPVDVEPASGPEASYAVLLKVPSGPANSAGPANPAGPASHAGRVYVFYNHNTDEVREVIADKGPTFPEGICRRVDSLGHYVFKYSDDGGRSWSERRYDVPMRTMAIDRQNPYQGELKFFWNVGKPFIHDGAAYISVHKVGGFGEGFFTSSEGVLIKSENLLTARDPAAITWETLPEGEVGLRTPPGGGPVAEEQSYVVLSDGTFYAVYRTIDGYPVEAYSRDKGRTWTARYRRYADGRLMKHPRAANFVWRCENGNLLTWFHNHGGRFIREHPQRRTVAYEDRNPVWLSGGVEVDTPEGKAVAWSQPEIGLYDDDPYVRISYPDLVEEDGRYFLTETQKDLARVHEVAPELLQGMWDTAHGVDAEPAVGEAGPVLALPDAAGSMPRSATLPELPPFLARDRERADYGTQDLRRGFSLEIRLQLESLAPGQVVLDNRTESGRGFCLQTTGRGTLELVLNDGRTESRWDCDPGWLRIDQTHHVVVVVDGGPKVITFIVDGALNDGGAFRQFGWGRYNPNLRSVDGAETLRIARNLQGEVLALRIYDRALRTFEAVAAMKARN